MSANIVNRSVVGRKENRQRKYIDIPEWGGSVLIQQLSAAQVSAIQAIAADAVDATRAVVKDRAKLSRFNFAMIRDSWITEDGEPQLTDDDYVAITQEPNTVLQTLVTAISEFNRMDAGAAQEAKKNLPAMANGVSGFN